ncbi:putative PEP-binding protein [Geitlerinema sp. PCC 9228]|uniref:putative PEP-binding protein n=1 Tax=Geitlerinema sp. PCC 9228 TaxID=111611 RepID=UPI0008F9DA0E|nr:putative PEP-binding protein [Geitlerinema sp. PCC 9228]
MNYLFWLNHTECEQPELVGETAFYLDRLAQKNFPVEASLAVTTELWRQFWETHNWLEPLLAELPYASFHINLDEPHQLSAIAGQIREEILAAELPVSLLEKLDRVSQELDTPVLMFRPSVSLPTHVWHSQRDCHYLLEENFCWKQPQQMALALKRLWAELFRARNLFYWQRSGIALNEIKLGAILQPVREAIASGTLQTKPDASIKISATWGLPKAMFMGEVVPDTYSLDPQTGELLQRELGEKSWTYQVAHYEGETSHLGQHASSDSTHPILWECLHAQTVSEPQRQEYVLSSDRLQHLYELSQTAASILGPQFYLEWVLAPSHPQQPPNLYVVAAYPETESLSPPQTSTAASSPAASTPDDSGETPSEDMTEPTPVPSPEPALVLSGTPASGGKAIGPALVLAGDASSPSSMPTDEGSNPPILVVSTLKPDFIPLLSVVAGVITEMGGMNSHGAILAREIGIPAVVGIRDATRVLSANTTIFIDGHRGEVRSVSSQGTTCAVEAQPQSETEGETGDGPKDWYQSHHREAATESDGASHQRHPLYSAATPSFPATATQIMLNLSQSTKISQAQALPVDGIGLLRSELMLLGTGEIFHPCYWVQQGHEEGLQEMLTEAIAPFVRSFYPRPVFYRALDLRSPEFQSLPGAPPFPSTANPMLAQRVSYLLDAKLFDVELAAIAHLRNSGYTNLHLLLPFVRSVEEFSFCRQRALQAGLVPSEQFQIWIMAEVPSVLFLMPEYAQAGLQGISIGSNDLTQLVLGVDREQPQTQLNECHPALRRALKQLVRGAREANLPVSICGQAPVSYPQLIEDFVYWGITSISVEPDAAAQTYHEVARAEQRLLLETSRHFHQRS